MRVIVNILLLLCLFGIQAAGQELSSNPTEPPGIEFLPGSTILPPLIANHQEPRVGVRIELGTTRLKLDIGSSLDFLGYTFDQGRSRQLRFGADFFTYALTTSYQGHRLQVDAVDGFFGGHIVYRAESERSALALRLRVLHLSAHMVDGHFEPSTGTWIDGRQPIPFTRDFGEVLVAYTFRVGAISIMPYGGVSYASLIRPSELSRWGGLCGFESHSDDWPGKVLGKQFEVYIADNLTLAGIPECVGTNMIEIGTKFGRWEGSGLRVYLNYVSGLELFSQYYNVHNDRWGAGFALDVR